MLGRIFPFWSLTCGISTNCLEEEEENELLVIKELSPALAAVNISVVAEFSFHGASLWGEH